MQYSVFEIKNSQRVLQNIVNEVEYKYKKSFNGADSVFILNLCESCKKKMKKYGHSANRDREIVFFDWSLKTYSFWVEVAVQVLILVRWR